MALGLHFFYIKQVAPRPSEQAHGARLALLLRLQRDNSLMVVYLGRCPRLYTSALSARVGYMGIVRGHHGIVPRHLPWPWGRAFGTRWPHGFARGIMGIATRHLS